MRSELQEPYLERLSTRRRGERIPASADGESTGARLEPKAVDAALADESMPMLAERRTRRGLASGGAPSVKIRRSIDVRHDATGNGIIDESSDALLRSLAEQLDLLHEQQRQIRRLLDQAGRRRLDAPILK